MSDKIRDKIRELGADWDEAESEILEFLDNRYKGVKDGIEFGDGENPRISKKMKFFQTNDEGVFLRIRLNKLMRLADSDKIRCRVVIADEKPDLIKVKTIIRNKPAKILKICKVNQDFADKTSEKGSLETFEPVAVKEVHVGGG